MDKCLISADGVECSPPEGPWLGDHTRTSVLSLTEQGGRLEAALQASALNSRKL